MLRQLSIIRICMVALKYFRHVACEVEGGVVDRCRGLASQMICRVPVIFITMVLIVLLHYVVFCMLVQVVEVPIHSFSVRRQRRDLQIDARTLQRHRHERVW